MAIKSKAVGIVCAVAAVLAVVRLVAWTGNSAVPEREASRLLVCEDCKAISQIDPEMLRLAYESGDFAPAPEGGVQFKCPSCGEIAARGQNLDFGANVVRCQSCEKTIIDSDSGAYKAVNNGDVRVDDEGQLAFRCSRCDEFSGRMTSTINPAGE